MLRSVLQLTVTMKYDAALTLIAGYKQVAACGYPVWTESNMEAVLAASMQRPVTRQLLFVQ